MPANESVPIIQHAIQLAVAPVFLLSGVASLLGVMAGRLARIIDRARDLEQRWAALDEKAVARARVEIANLERRRHLASWSINFCTSAALLVCLVIVTLFFEEFFKTDLRWLAGAQFVGVMVALIGGLSSFLREVYLATHTGRIQADRFVRRQTSVDSASNVILTVPEIRDVDSKGRYKP
jgi:hypothetical protein